MIKQSIKINKNNDFKEPKRLKINIYQDKSNFKLLVERYAIDSLTNSVYLKLCFSNVILSFDCSIARDFLNALTKINDFTKCKIIETTQDIKWSDIPFDIEINQKNKKTAF